MFGKSLKGPRSQMVQYNAVTIGGEGEGIERGPVVARNDSVCESAVYVL